MNLELDPCCSAMERVRFSGPDGRFVVAARPLVTFRSTASPRASMLSSNSSSTDRPTYGGADDAETLPLPAPPPPGDHGAGHHPGALLHDCVSGRREAD